MGAADGSPVGAEAGVSGTVGGAYNFKATCGATMLAEVVWEGASITGFLAGVKGNASMSLNANAKISGKAYFHAYLLNYVELNMGALAGPEIVLSIKPIVTLDVIAGATGTVSMSADWKGKVELSNRADP